MSVVFSPIFYHELLRIVAYFNKTHKILYSNFYGLNNNTCEYFITDSCLLIRYKEFDFYRLYVISNDAEQLKSTLSQLANQEYVINIPSKKGIDEWLGILNYSGFRYYETYSRYYRKVKDRKYDVNGIVFAKSSELNDIARLIYNNFSKYTDHLPSLEELQTMIEKEQVLVDHDANGIVCGVNIFTISGSTVYGNAWIDKGENAINLYLASKNVWADKGVKHNYFWVRDSNTKVLKMHIRLGAKADGLKDYTFIKRNTL